MLDWLEKRHAAIMDCEKEAYTPVWTQATRHRRLQVQNAGKGGRKSHRTLPECRKNSFAALPPETGQWLHCRQAAAFAGGASNALGLIPFFICPALLLVS